jgi:hypothetical protein
MLCHPTTTQIMFSSGRVSISVAVIASRGTCDQGKARMEDSHERELQMSQCDFRESPIPDAQSAGTCGCETATRLPDSRSRRTGKTASSRVRRAFWITAVFAGLMVEGCTSLPQTSNNECVGPVS